MVGYKDNNLGAFNNNAYLTPSPLGHNDHGDPSKRNMIYGPTPGPIGINDIGDPAIMSALLMGQLPTTGGKLAKKDTFKIAIELFRKSPQSKSEIGKKVITTLDNAYNNKKLKFTSMPETGKSDSSTGIIEITDMYSENPIKASSWLIHEAYHLSVKGNGMLYVDEEIESRKLQADFELFLINNQVSLPDGSVFQAKEESTLLSIYRKNQLIDWIITAYKDEKDFEISKDWILKHKDDWNGLCHRTRNTRKYYAKILVDSQPTLRSRFNLSSIEPQVAVTLSMLLNCEGGVYASEIKKAVGEEDVNIILESIPKKN